MKFVIFTARKNREYGTGKLVLERVTVWGWLLSGGTLKTSGSIA